MNLANYENSMFNCKPMPSESTLIQLLTKNSQNIGHAPSLKSYKRGETLYHQNQPCEGLYLIQSGIVGLKVSTASGKEHLLRFYGQNQFFGHRSLLTDEPHHSSALALEQTVCLFFHKQGVTQLIKNNISALQAFALLLAKELKFSELHRVLILENQILARTAQAIIYLKEMGPSHQWTRQEVAEFIASTPTTIIKALAELENRGLILQVGRRIEILDKAGLLAIPENEVF